MAIRRPARVPFFSGLLRCIDCRLQWFTVWNARAPHIICHECGGMALPVGPQVPSLDVPGTMLGELFRLDLAALRRTMS